MSPRFRKAVPYVLIVVLGISFFALCFACPLSNNLFWRPFLADFDPRYAKGSIDPIPFDRDLWNRKAANHRVGMARHFANQQLLEGKTRSELVEMLGEPDIEKNGDEGMRWLLAFKAKGLFDETIWLELTIQDDGKATGAIVGRDWYDPRRK